jgi:hypothetical protein
MIALSQETAHRWTREYVCASNALWMSCACLMGWPGYQDADSMSRRTVRSGEGLRVHPARLGPAAPVFDAVVVGCEAVVDAP